MESKTRDSTGAKTRKRSNRVLHGTGERRSVKKKPISKSKLTRIVNGITKNWDRYESFFVNRCDEKALVLKLKSLAHDETLYTTIWVQHGNNVTLLQANGRSKRFDRERLLGYILLYTGNPIIHEHTWYTGIAYSDQNDVRRKYPQPICTDQSVRLYAAGIGKFDYLFCYKAKTREHDEAGHSDGATHLSTADQWRDGL